VSVTVAVLVFGVLIAIHEGGHFVAARWAGMRVDSYSIGFGPALAAFTRGETEYRIGLLPFGGFVRIAGMNPADDIAPDDPASFSSKPVPKRLLVIVAGALTNYALAWALLVALLVWGMPSQDVTTARVGTVNAGAPAAAAGLQPGDRVLSVQGQPVGTFAELADAVHARPGTPTELRVERGGQTMALQVTPGPDGRVGVLPPETLERLGLIEALGRASKLVVVNSVATLESIGQIVTRKSHGDLMGPVGIASIVAQQAALGLRQLLRTVIAISIALGLFNLLPVPALDGGRAAFLLVEAVRGKPMNARAEMIVHLVGLVLLLGLIAVVTVGDVGRLLGR
jgi:regulator of sigma E protease